MFDPKLEFIVDATAVDPPAVTVETIAAALAKVRRYIICSPDVEEQLREAVEEAGLTATVTVQASDLLDPRTAYITKPGMLAEQLAEGKAQTGFAQRWVMGSPGPDARP